MEKVIKKPIAVITHSISRAIDYIMQMKDIREVQGAKRRLIGKDGQEYIIITDIQHLYGMEISGTIIIPGAARNKNYEAIYELARTRIR